MRKNIYLHKNKCEVSPTKRSKFQGCKLVQNLTRSKDQQLKNVASHDGTYANPDCIMPFLWPKILLVQRTCKLAFLLVLTSNLPLRTSGRVPICIPEISFLKIECYFGIVRYICEKIYACPPENAAIFETFSQKLIHSLHKILYCYNYTFHCNL